LLVLSGCFFLHLPFILGFLLQAHALKLVAAFAQLGGYLVFGAKHIVVHGPLGGYRVVAGSFSGGCGLCLGILGRFEGGGQGGAGNFLQGGVGFVLVGEVRKTFSIDLKIFSA
jgi:hypothetical protein